MDPNPENMTVEQLQSLSSVMEEANRLIQSFDQVKPAIAGLKEPTMDLVSDVLTVFHRSTVEPAIQSVDDSVSKWIVITFLSILLLLVVVGCYFYWASTKIRSIAVTLKSITEDYEIVPKRLAQKKGS
jgi:predicted PurR-regulated permease PerM